MKPTDPLCAGNCCSRVDHQPACARPFWLIAIVCYSRHVYGSFTCVWCTDQIKLAVRQLLHSGCWCGCCTFWCLHLEISFSDAAAGTAPLLCASLLFQWWHAPATQRVCRWYGQPLCWRDGAAAVCLCASMLCCLSLLGLPRPGLATPTPEWCKCPAPQPIPFLATLHCVACCVLCCML